MRDLNRPYFGICLGHQLRIEVPGGRCAVCICRKQSATNHPELQQPSVPSVRLPAPAIP
ncbi:glutamine amidotransferase-related protein, partial [Ruegeria haliotis]|uniref:glutamine amidotransferase-related protein n=1 Tax=Ruegeria haliotis TaxID=2747601 RepID=UPI0038B6127D